MSAASWFGRDEVENDDFGVNGVITWYPDGSMSIQMNETGALLMVSLMLLSLCGIIMCCWCAYRKNAYSRECDEW